MEGELKVCHMRYQFAQYEFLIRSVPKTTRFPSERSFRPNYLKELIRNGAILMSHWQVVGQSNVGWRKVA